MPRQKSAHKNTEVIVKMPAGGQTIQYCPRDSLEKCRHHPTKNETTTTTKNAGTIPNKKKGRQDGGTIPYFILPTQSKNGEGIHKCRLQVGLAKRIRKICRHTLRTRKSHY